jgi:hypothetical protein
LKLTKSIRAVIVTQFKTGDTMEYLAKLYGFSVERIEGVIRDWMIATEGSVKNAS